MTPLKVLVFAEYGWRNGGENSWLAVAKRLRQKNVLFTVACPPNTEFSRHLTAIGIETSDWQLIDESGSRKSQQEIRSDIQRLLQLHQPNIAHANSLSSSRLVGPVAQAMQIPALGYLRDIIKISRQAMKDINCLNTIVAVSAATRDFHREHGLTLDRSTYIHNGVDLEQFGPCDPSGYLHEELKLKAGTKFLLCIGQIGLRKGTEKVIESMLRLNQQFDDLALLIIGMRNSTKDESIEFEKHCIRLSQSAANIFWLGRRNDVDKIMQESHLLLHAARQEPLGRVLLEALASALPMVATDVGGTREIISTAKLREQCLTPVDSPKQMAEKAATLLGDPQLHGRTSVEFRCLAESNFDISKCAHNLLREYHKLNNK